MQDKYVCCCFRVQPKRLHIFGELRGIGLVRYGMNRQSVDLDRSRLAPDRVDAESIEDLKHAASAPEARGRMVTRNDDCWNPGIAKLAKPVERLSHRTRRWTS